MVEVFKTNVQQTELATQLASALSQRFPFLKINFDLEDCDKILRIEGGQVCVETVIKLLSSQGYECEVLL
jgi:predicted RNA binding protein with dsRBD fold (UPF0201 family)